MSTAMEEDISKHLDINEWRNARLSRLFGPRSWARLEWLKMRWHRIILRSKATNSQDDRELMAPLNVISPEILEFYHTFHPNNSDIQTDFGFSNTYMNWYIGFLERKIALLTAPISQRAILGIPEHETDKAVFVRICRILRDIVGILLNKASVSLDDYVVELSESGRIACNDVTQSFLAQYVFILLGLTTMFYTPSLQLEPGKIGIVITQYKGGRRRRTSAWLSSEMRLEKVINASIEDIMRLLGGTKGPMPRIISPGTPRAQDDVINTLNISYYTLTVLAGIQILWVDSLCEHLEFDYATKILKLFRFPSYCAFLCSQSDDTTFLCRVLDNYYHCQALRTSIPGSTIASGTFFREILFSYRLIFGQDQRSWQAFRKRYGSKLSEEQLLAGWDPLLHRLCGCDWTKEPLYEYLEAPYVRTVYSAAADFPFLGQRWIDLHSYVTVQCPNNLSSLWRDRRDIGRYWALWAVFFFGLITVIIGAVQIVLAAGQIAKG